MSTHSDVQLQHTNIIIIYSKELALSFIVNCDLFQWMVQCVYNVTKVVNILMYRSLYNHMHKGIVIIY